MQTGTLGRMFADRGFGFLFGEDRERGIFVHVKELYKSNYFEPALGDVYEFEIEPDRAGRAMAVNLKRIRKGDGYVE